MTLRSLSVVGVVLYKRGYSKKTLDQYLTTVQVSKESVYDLRYDSLIKTSNAEEVHDLDVKVTERGGGGTLKLGTISNYSPSIKRIQPWVTEIWVFKNNLTKTSNPKTTNFPKP